LAKCKQSGRCRLHRGASGKTSKWAIGAISLLFVTGP